MVSRLNKWVRAALRQGLTPNQLALTLALGITLGVLPTVWGTSLLCVLAAWMLRLNQPLLQLVNCLVFPLQILLFVPFLQLGIFLFGGETPPLVQAWEPRGLLSEPLQTLRLAGEANLLAVAGWALAAPPLVVLCYGIGIVAVAGSQKLRRKAAT
ncbi:MAG: DUF2062 domain-containing protein [Trichloromonadaceae bacterium]